MTPLIPFTSSRGARLLPWLVFPILVSLRASGAELIERKPYFSFEDSPFRNPEFMEFETFVLEDFEDSSFDTGWTATAGGLCAGGCYTDSVDGDDGMIDGAGDDGISWCVGPACPSDTPAVSVEFEFAPTLGQYPTHAGLVWTDGLNSRATPGPFSVEFEWLDPFGKIIQFHSQSNPGDDSFRGETAEDFFVGVAHREGISRLRIRAVGAVDYVEVDHLQYGWASLEFHDPIQNMIASGGNPYAAFDSLDKEKSRYRYHTGADVSHQSLPPYKTPVYAAADGEVVKIVRTSDTVDNVDTGCDPRSYEDVSDTNRGLGNAVIVKHPFGLYSLYGHLRCIEPGVAVGNDIFGGVTILGFMGDSGGEPSVRYSPDFGPHLHFEIKTLPVLGDNTNGEDKPGMGFVGYVPDIPDGYGYRDPTAVLCPFDSLPMTPLLVEVRVEELAIRSGPSSELPDGCPIHYPLLGRVRDGDRVVAHARNGDWYRIDLPNANGAVHGWIPRVVAGQEQLEELPAGLQGRVGRGNRELGQAAGDSSAVTTRNPRTPVRIWKGQGFGFNGRAAIAGQDWCQIRLPLSVDADNGDPLPNYSSSSGWLRCADLEIGRAGSWLLASDRESPGRILAVDPRSGSTDEITTVNGDLLMDLAETPDGRLFVTTKDMLFEITEKGDAEIVLEGSYEDVVALGARADGQLYAGTGPGGLLLTIDLQTRTVEPIGELTEGYYFCGDLAFSALSELYAIVDRSLVLCSSPSLARIDLDRLEPQLIADIDLADAFGLTIGPSGGVLVSGNDRGAVLLEIDPTDGEHKQRIRVEAESLGGLTSNPINAPEPSSWTSAATGVLAVLTIAWRRRRPR